MKIGGFRFINLPLLCFIACFFAVFVFAQRSYAADDHLVINEVYYDTVGADKDEEWIELYNPTSEEIDLSGYSLISENDSSYFFPEKTLIKSLSFLVLARSDLGFYALYNMSPDISGLTLNLSNAGDYVVLLDEDENELDAVFWERAGPKNEKFALPAKTGHSIERNLLGIDTDDCNVDFVDRETATPGAQGAQQLEETEEEQDEQVLEAKEGQQITIENARSLENGEEISLIGTVTVAPGVLSNQYFYMQDDSGGIQVYSYFKNFPSLQVGDIVQVAGELSEINKERRLKISKAEDIVIQNHTIPPEPEEVPISEIGETQEGELVSTAGIVVKTSGDTFYITDGKKEIKVQINKSTGIEKPKMKKGDEVEVTGIVSQYKDDYRILPIDQDDVKIVSTEETLPRAGIEDCIYFILSLITLFLWNIYLTVKKKLIVWQKLWRSDQKAEIF